MSRAPRFAVSLLTGLPRPRLAWRSQPVTPVGRRRAGPASVTGMLLAALLLPLAASVAQAASLAFLLQRAQAAVAPVAARPAAPLTARIGRTVFFAATDAAHGTELWKSDGTLRGTRLVSDINPGSGRSNPSDLVSFQGRLLFVANDGRHGAELWQSDGTLGGTALVADLNPAAADAHVGNLTVVGDRLFFTADDGTHGTELWVYDGATLSLVKDINRGAGGSGPNSLINVDGNLLFSADDGAHGFQLWRTDGTPVNTSMVQVINPARDACPYCLAPEGMRSNFSPNHGARGALWRQTGGAAASQVRNNKPGDGSNRLWLTAAGNTLFFRADSGTRGRVLWRAVHASYGTQPVTNTPSSVSNSPCLTRFPNQSNIAANDGRHLEASPRGDWLPSPSPLCTDWVRRATNFRFTPPFAQPPLGLLIRAFALRGQERRAGG
jgi:ELWxxDGT repeat protein